MKNRHSGSSMNLQNGQPEKVVAPWCGHHEKLGTPRGGHSPQFI